MENSRSSNSSSSSSSSNNNSSNSSMQDYNYHHKDEEALLHEHCSLPLAQALKSGTTIVHAQAESVHFIRNLFKGRIDGDTFARLLTTFYHVYQRMESLLDTHGPVCFPNCHFPRQLARTTALAEDLDFWLGSNDSIPVPSAATQDYLARLNEVGRTNPLLLLSHAYTRYLGDLSGGKLLYRVVKRALHVDDDGLDFFQFPNIASAVAFKEHYKAALNGLPLTPIQVKALVQEANVAFMLNVRLFQEMDVEAGVPGATVQPLEQSLALANIYHHQVPPAEQPYHYVLPSEADSSSTTRPAKEEQKGPSSCPFLKHPTPSVSATTTAATIMKQRKQGTCPFHQGKTWIFMTVAMASLFVWSWNWKQPQV